MSNPDPISNSNSNSKLDSSTTRKPTRLHTSQSHDTITGNGLVASPVDTHFPDSQPNPSTADTHNDSGSESHYMTFAHYRAEGGRYAELDMGGTMLSLGSDPSMSSFGSGSGCAFAPLPTFLQQGNTEAGPTLPESGNDIPRRFTSQVTEKGMFQSMDMSLKPTARVTRRFGSVVLHDPPRSESAPPSIGAVTLRSPSSDPDPDLGSDTESPSTPLPPQVISTSGSRE